MEKKHCCTNCTEDCSDEIKKVLDSKRTIFFCSSKCLDLWEKAREIFLKEKENKNA